MKRLLALLLLWPGLALAQTSPNLRAGQVPTATQWNKYFSDKQDTLGYRALNKGGDVMLGPLRFSMTAPVLSACGVGATMRGNNQAGEVTTGTGNPIGCVITFAGNPWSAVPSCLVTWQAQLTSTSYTVTQSALTLVQTATSSNKINYLCVGLQ